MIEKKILASAWNKFIILIQMVFRDMEVPREMTNTFLLMIPKQDSKKIRGIGIIDISWKVISYIIKRRIAMKIKLHKEIHGFRSEHGTRTAIMESKIWTNYQHSKKNLVFKVFLDVKAAYDTVNRDKLIQIIGSYG